MKWLNKIPTPAGLFATNDSLAIRVLEACQRAGIRVPEEIAVVGTENEEMLCSFARPPLTSVAFDGETVGMRAAEMLDGMMRGERPEPCVYVAPKGIVRRQSSDEMVMADRVVATALYMIRQEACDGLGVSDLVEHLNVSRSTLERRMRAAIGRAPKAEILRHRFLRVEELLRSSDKTVETIAGEAGFENPNYLHQVFRQRYGMTPNQFRQSFTTR